MARPTQYESLKDIWVERQQFLARTIIAFVGCLTVAVILMFRLFGLQVLQHAYYNTRSDDNRMRLVVVPPVRGLVYDRNGAVLAQNMPSYVLEVTPERVDDLGRTLKRLTRVVALSDDHLERFRDRLRKTPKFRGVPLRTRLSIEEAARFEVNQYDYPGVDITAALSRQYPLGESAAHVVGYIGGITDPEIAQFGERQYEGTSHVGKIGVERSHELDLHGALGTKIVESNAAGRPLRELDYKRGAPGLNLFLTLDARLQLAAERALGELEGAVVAIDPRNGEVLALVSKPGFDPHLFVEGIDKASYKTLSNDPTRPLFNRALTGQYPPGSTIKPAMAYAGLANRVLDPHHSVFCPGHYSLPGSSRQYRCWKRSGHGWLNLIGGVQRSCDVYFYQAAQKLGIDRIHATLAPFGLGSSTGLDLPGEKGGLLPSSEWKQRARREVWFPGETLSVGVGQGYMLLTPVQLAQMAARLAMRGRGFKPHVVHAVQDGQSGVITKVAPESLPALPGDAHLWNLVIDSMASVTMRAGGTAYSVFKDAPYSSGGKTGTAQVAALAQGEAEAPDLEDTPKHLRDHALFIAFAPLDEPRIAIGILAEHAGHGGSAAAPVARKVLDAYLLQQSPEPPPVKAHTASAAPLTPAAKPQRTAALTPPLAPQAAPPSPVDGRGTGARPVAATTP